MLGKQSAQRQLFTADNLDLSFVGEQSVYAFFARHARTLFVDEDFAPLYRQGGRPSVPPSLLAVAVLLQRIHNLSDQALIDATKFDLRFKVALGLAHHEGLCAKSTFQHFRAQLVIHDLDQWLHNRTVDLAKAQNVLKRSGLAVALDTSPVLGRGAVRDTINLLGDGIAKLLRVLAMLADEPLAEFAAGLGLGRYVDEAKSLKGHAAIDWNDDAAIRGFLRSVVADADALLKCAGERLATLDEPAATKLRQAAELLVALLAQDIERDGGPADDPGPAIREGTARDRIVSTSDPEMRHGRKSKTKRFDGHKAAIAVDTESGIILDVEAKPGNAGDNHDALATIERIETQHEVEVDVTLGDCAYGDGGTRADFAEAERELIAKCPKPSNVQGKLPKQAFTIDLENGTVTCPAGQTATDGRRHGDGFTLFRFDTATCATCPLHAQCCSGKGGRTIQVHPQEELLQAARTYQQTDEFAQRYVARQRAEHRLARMVQLGARQARYFGLRKTTAQLRLTAAAANLLRVLAVLGGGLFWALCTLFFHPRQSDPFPRRSQRTTTSRAMCFTESNVAKHRMKRLYSAAAA